MRLMDGLRFAVGTLTVFPVRVERVDRVVAGSAMSLAPGVGLVLGAVAGLPLLLPGPPLLGAALALGLLALLTRGLHLDGLADLADGLGSGKPSGQALDIMKKSDIGPFGVMTLVFTLLVQAVALAEAGFAALVTACVAGRLALTWACRAGVPSARPDGLGAMVAGTVRRPAVWLVTVAALCAVALAGPAVATAAGPGGWAADLSAWLTGARDTSGLAPGMVYPDPPPGWSGIAPEFSAGVEWGPAFLPQGATELLRPEWGRSLVVAPLALLAGLAAALLLLRHARRRLGGITGDVLGALVETATATALAVYAILG
ncbi:adenosylcobinamide-GDP ribazoletransferase [Nonomuraea terrae]|uniref:Adenosylcobinamide-GDP ribazoletransferase n=1 Tax=Nonomuraea terrae TaxID=2530383 RepID=A0A4R4Y3H1_9ACTN|nr:adenosylcobinamide-GDP ribazoletransferase [Nonomuraea terrae]TDD38931.1 adenosylcobinamide-GDP ribazoletransferase [Nonomuraea terrae]